MTDMVLNGTQLLRELTIERVNLLKTLRAMGPCSVYALAKKLGRNYYSVNVNVNKLREIKLVAEHDHGGVYVPYDSVLFGISLLEPLDKA